MESAAIQQPLAYLDVALLTCSVCELLGTMESEVRLVWQGTRNVSWICYIVARYTCIVSFIIFVIIDAPQSSVRHNSSFLEHQGLVASWLLSINLLFVEVIFSIRTWALWEQSKKVGIWLIVLIVLLWGSTFGLLVTITIGSRLDILNVYLGSFTAFYLITTILVGVKVYRRRRHLDASFVRLVHAQSLTYYTFLFALSLSALVITLLIGATIINFIARVIQFTFTHMACRMSLSLLAQNDFAIVGLSNDRNEQDHTAFLSSDLDFRHSFETRQAGTEVV